MSKIRVVLAEDHETVREGLKLLIDSQSDMETIGEAGNGNLAIKLTQELKPDLVLMDISMPEMNGLKATKKLKECCPDIYVLTLTRHTDESFLQQLLSAGASGYVLKQSAPSELIRAIRAVASGSKYLDTSITEKVVGGYLKQPAVRTENSGSITEREAEVLKLIAWGYSNKEIAARLQLSVKTVEVHKANAMKKMDMNSRIDIVRYALLQGWLQDT
jgi:DNA-binding NarL/FixJ family response regulator